MRAQRLMDLLELLRARDTISVAEIAKELAITERTVFRDLAALRDRGLPVTGEAGPGGGIRLERDRGVPSVHLSADEVVSLWLSAELSRRASALPWGEAAQSGMNKLLASVSKERARELRALLRRVVVGRSASDAVRDHASTPSTELVAVFERAFTRGIGLAFHYRDRFGNETERSIEPHGLLVEPPVWYLLSRDIAKGEARTFRMDRVSQPRLLTEHTFRPDLDIVRRLAKHVAEGKPHGAA